MTDQHFYFLLLGELYTEVDDQLALQHFQKAFLLAKTQADKLAIRRKMESLEKK